MVIYNGYYGQWMVDWDLVAFLDPDYAKKYLSTRQPLPEFSDVSVTDTTEWMRQRAQADRLIQREHEIREYDRYISKDKLTEEDKAILDLMHTPAGKNTEPTVQQVDQMVPVRIPPRIDDPAEILGTDGNESGAEVFYSQKEGCTTTRTRERVKAKSNYRYGTYHVSDAHFAAQRINPPAPTVPLLPLPRNFLGTGSKMVVNDHLRYEAQKHILLDDHSILRAEMFIENETHLKLVHYAYTINKVYNTHRPNNMDKKRLVFNKNNGNLFVIAWERKDRAKKGRHYMKIRSITTHLNYLTIHCSSFAESLFRKFAHRMFEITRDKIGATPVFNPIGNASTRADVNARLFKFVMALLWQFKVGRPLPWVSENILDAVTVVREAWAQYHHPRLVGDEPFGTMRFSKKIKPRGLFKKLQKKPHPTTLFKALLGPAYSNTTYKLALRIHEGRHYYNMINFIELMLENENKTLYHFVSHLVNSSADNTRDVLQALMDAVHEMVFGRRPEVNKPIFNKYIKALTSQFANISNEPEVIKWELFRDTVNMANRYNISINANQLCKHDVVRELHDKFVRFINRDKTVQRELANTEFVEFPHPIKEYDGFTFQFLKNAAELVEEGCNMNHCVGSYGHRCVAGESIIFSMRKNGVGFATIELDGNDFNLRIVQKYTRHDVTINNPKILDIINQWHNDVKQLNKDKDHTYSNQCAIITRYVAIIATIVDKSIPDDMKISLHNSVIQDDKIIDELGLREYVKRVLVNNQKISANLQKAKEPYDDGFVYTEGFGCDVPTARAPLRAVQVPAQGVREVPGGDVAQIMEELRDLMNRITEVGNG